MRTAAAAAALAARWLPEALVILETVPRGSTGKPMRIGLAKHLCMHPLSTTALEGPGISAHDYNSVDIGELMSSPSELEASLRELVRSTTAQLVGGCAVDFSMPFMDIEVDSISAATLATVLSHATDFDISLTLGFDHSTPEAAVAHLLLDWRCWFTWHHSGSAPATL